MIEFVILETEQGLVVAEIKPGERVEDVAVAHGGLVVDAGPFKSHDEAHDALMDMNALAEEDEDM